MNPWLRATSGLDALNRTGRIAAHGNDVIATDAFLSTTDALLLL